MPAAARVPLADRKRNLTAFHRQDGAWLGSIDIAQKQGLRRRAFDMTSADLGAEAQPGKPLYGIEASNDGRLIVFGGGTVDQDEGALHAVDLWARIGDQRSTAHLRVRRIRGLPDLSLTSR